MKGILGDQARHDPGLRRDNRIVPVTVVKAGPCVVTQSGPGEGWLPAVQLAFGAIDPRKVNKPEAGHFAKAAVTPRRHLAELRTTDAGEYTVGQEIAAEVFEAGSVGTSPAPPRATAPRVS